MKAFLNSMLWYVKQLLPLTYRSHYEEKGKPVFHVWQMWFGVCFNQEKYYIKEVK